ncbi:MAG: hypothetical protein J4432_01255 [DPANN group archaeon]|nr:hypothetical protein [DPANN group archaeon]
MWTIERAQQEFEQAKGIMASRGSEVPLAPLIEAKMQAVGDYRFGRDYYNALLHLKIACSDLSYSARQVQESNDDGVVRDHLIRARDELADEAKDIICEATSELASLNNQIQQPDVISD